jgi:hypothetical protein
MDIVDFPKKSYYKMLICDIFIFLSVSMTSSLVIDETSNIIEFVDVNLPLNCFLNSFSSCIFIDKTASIMTL